MKKIKNILFIDDDDITCFINRSIIEELQISEGITCLDDEQQALNYLKEKCGDKGAGVDACPAIIFLDLNMPFFNAFEILEQLEEEPAVDRENLFIVLLTSSLHTRDREKAKSYNVQGYLNKPLNPDKVIDVVKRFHQRYPHL
ncbi:response regulator [Cesiribacter sp. SM1]|uniref:response regulator n=1 Tax=Cesiribacter sp. SM1 TaxID=2861196 RepID=UPI001CD816D3|nr:response regulator [Cesiribacter sp. SM1]